jgi:hypothetical protein
MTSICSATADHRRSRAVASTSDVGRLTSPSTVSGSGWSDGARPQPYFAEEVIRDLSPSPPGKEPVHGYLVAPHHLENDSDQTQTVLGQAYGNGLPRAFVGASPPEGIIGVSTPNREIDEGGLVFTGVKFVLPGVIPPHQLRAMRVLWFSNTCLQGDSESGNDEVALRVRVGWITRTEIISLSQGWYVAGPSTGKYAISAPYCG